MEKHNISKNIVFLPGRFYAVENISIYFLLRDTGYFEMHDQITEANLFEALIQYPECINQWLSWSEDKRSNSGWYFKQSENGKYVVGYFPTKDGLKINEYSEIAKACAAFIKHEIEDIRNELKE